MSHTKHWIIDVYVDPEDATGTTCARVVLRFDGHQAPVELKTDGHAHRNPHDHQIPIIGAELAAARALSALVTKLEAAAAEELSAAATPPMHAG